MAENADLGLGLAFCALANIRKECFWHGTISETKIQFLKINEKPYWQC